MVTRKFKKRRFYDFFSQKHWYYYWTSRTRDECSIHKANITITFMCRKVMRCIDGLRIECIYFYAVILNKSKTGN